MQDANQQQALEAARRHFLGGRMLEAYGLFRRFFDRLPFKAEPAHATYIGMFVRILFELGKNFELNFYLRELERLHGTAAEAHLSYALGVVYAYSEEPHRKGQARLLFERIVADPNANGLHAKARMMLADGCYEQDVAAARAWLRDAVAPPGDDVTRRLLGIWDALLTRREGNAQSAREKLEAVIAEIREEDGWYELFSAKIVLGTTLLDLGETKEAERVSREVRELFAGRRWKLAELQLKYFEEQLSKKRWGQPLRLVKNEGDVELCYGARRLRLERTQRADQLLLELVEKKALDKPGIIELLYHRPYAAESDDRLVYYHAHSLRKRLRRLGLPSAAVETFGEGYRLLPEVELEENIA